MEKKLRIYLKEKLQSNFENVRRFSFTEYDKEGLLVVLTDKELKLIKLLPELVQSLSPRKDSSSIINIGIFWGILFIHCKITELFKKIIK